MSSITGYTDPHYNTDMTAYSARRETDRQRKQLWKAEGAAYLLAILAHLGLWQLYQSMPPPPQPEEPLIIEAALVAPKLAAAAAPAAAPPPPKAQPAPPKPQPKPKPVPKVEKPAVKKPDKPKPVPKPRPELRAEAEPAPAPAPAPPAPAVEEAPPAPAVSHAKPAPKHEAGDGEDHAYHAGGISGFSRRYPRLAQERGWEGTVTLKVHIRADGDIGEVIVVGSSGHEILDEQAVELVKEARAKPARRGDTPVDSWVIVPYQFKLAKRPKATPAESEQSEPQDP